MFDMPEQGEWWSDQMPMITWQLWPVWQIGLAGHSPSKESSQK
jgi:hypothetical protein